MNKKFFNNKPSLFVRHSLSDGVKLRPINNLFKKIFGIILIFLGIAGLFLPFIQGILLISIGTFFLFGKEAKKYLTKIKNFFKSKF